MDYEKKYKEALETARKLNSGEGVAAPPGWTVCEVIFPELKESEDELTWLTRFIKEEAYSLSMDIRDNEDRIKFKKLQKSLDWLESKREQYDNEDLNILQRFSFYSYKDEPNILYLSGVYVNEKCRNKGIGTKILEVADEVAKSLNCHAIRLKTKKGTNAERLYRTHGYNSLATKEKNEIWFEKQVGQKPADKVEPVEPKFHEGDWICTDMCIAHIASIYNGMYYFDEGDGLSIVFVDKYYHIWTLQDIQDGDVLFSLDSNQPFIYKERKLNEQATAYCGLNIYGKFFVWGTKDCVITLSNYIPATKEQRDLLFEKTREAGWEWDAETKKLYKKLETFPILSNSSKVGKNEPK